MAKEMERVVATRLPPAVYKKLEKVAEAKGVTVAIILRQALKNYLDTPEAARASI
jgi:predicted transcriptional regulator